MGGDRRSPPHRRERGGGGGKGRGSTVAKGNGIESGARGEFGSHGSNVAKDIHAGCGDNGAIDGNGASGSNSATGSKEIKGDIEINGGSGCDQRICGSSLDLLDQGIGGQNSKYIAGKNDDMDSGCTVQKENNVSWSNFKMKGLNDGMSLSNNNEDMDTSETVVKERYEGIDQNLGDRLWGNENVDKLNKEIPPDLSYLNGMVLNVRNPMFEDNVQEIEGGGGCDMISSGVKEAGIISGQNSVNHENWMGKKHIACLTGLEGVCDDVHARNQHEKANSECNVNPGQEKQWKTASGNGNRRPNMQNEEVPNAWRRPVHVQIDWQNKLRQGFN